MKKFDEGYDFVVMGHRHYAYTYKEKNGMYMNLGDWVRIFSYGEFKNGEFKLKKFYDLESKKIIAPNEREI